MNRIQKASKPNGLRRFSMVQLLIALGILFFTVPFIDELENSELIISVLFSVVMLSAVVSVANRRRTLVIALMIVIPTLGSRWINHVHSQLLPAHLFLIGGICLIAFVVFHLLQFVLGATEVDAEVLCASVSAYVMLGLIWTMAYWLVDTLNPGAFAFNTSGGSKTMEGFNAFYFSFITLCTVGYGDITPISKVARMLAALEAMVGLLYVAVLIARLVGLSSNISSKRISHNEQALPVENDRDRGN